MRSRAVRLTLLLLFVVAAGVTAYLFWTGETRAHAELETARSFDERAVSVARAIAELRGSQQAYVAAGQGDQFWAEKVSTGLSGVRANLADLRAASVSTAAPASLDAALASLGDFEKMDGRAREYAKGGQLLLASDIIFADGLDLTSAAARAVDEARAAEDAARGVALAGVRSRQLFALGAAGAAALLVIVLLVPGAQARGESDTDLDATPVVADLPDVKEDLALSASLDEGWSRPKKVVAPDPPVAAEPAPLQAAQPVASAIDLDAVASLCTDLARLVDTRTLPSILERAATALDATGIVLWIADPDGRELSPIVTHGYPSNVVNRLGTILRDDRNATASAFRTSLVQTVKTDSISKGAIAAPLVTPSGCVGVMAAEVRHEGEQNGAKLATATIVAAQLATLVGPPPSRSQKAEAAG